MIVSNKSIPVGIQINPASGKCKLLINNQSYLVTELIYCNPVCKGHLDPLMVKESLERLEQEVPGTVDWFNWGPRLN